MYKVFEVFWRFLLLGLMSFGGPAAHIAYFRRQFVEDKKWLDDEAYAGLVALSQFLPGPGSSQVGFALGYRYAGLGGAVAAFLAFTMPSFVLLYALAESAYLNQQTPHVLGAIQGLKLLAVVVVADAVVTMFKNFCNETTTVIIALLTATGLILLPSLWMQMGCLLVAAVIGSLIGKGETKAKRASQAINYLPLGLFILLFIGLPLVEGSVWLQLFSQFYQAGSLVFGGGHVVLPLLQQTIGDAVSDDRFIMGYAAAQAVPGPMFTLATFLGAEIAPKQPLIGALTATLAIFLPGFLLVLSFQNIWQSLAEKPNIAGAIWGINASVVGLLIAAFYSPVVSSAIYSIYDVAIVMAGYCLLRFIKLPILVLVLSFLLIGIALY